MEGEAVFSVVAVATTVTGELVVLGGAVALCRGCVARPLSVSNAGGVVASPSSSGIGGQ